MGEKNDYRKAFKKFYKNYFLVERYEARERSNE